jgi:hypothetical protein
MRSRDTLILEIACLSIRASSHATDAGHHLIKGREARPIADLTDAGLLAR